MMTTNDCPICRGWNCTVENPHHALARLWVTIEVDHHHGGAHFATVRGVNFEKDFEGESPDDALRQALTWIRDSPEGYVVKEVLQ